MTIINGVSKFITAMTKYDAKPPIVALEATVTGGRTIQAHERGGKNESRERLIEETTGAIVWLWGVSTINDYIGDPILKKLFGEQFDVGTDKVLRTPFENFMNKYPSKKFTKKQIALIKASKVLLSVLIADAFIGLVVPPLNQKLTRTLIAKDKEQAKKASEQKNTQDKLDIIAKKEQPASTSPSFKGNPIDAINIFTNAIENTNIGKLLSCDVGLTGGRIYSARNNDERREIAIRDITSIYFYMWAQGHIGNLLNLILTGKADRIDPNSTNNLHEHLVKFLKNRGGEMSVEDFRKAALGDKNVKLPEGIEKYFESGELSSMENLLNRFRKTKIEPLQVAKVDDLKQFFDPNTFNRIIKMSEIQPKRQGVSVITKQQIIDAINESAINDAEFLDKLFSDFTGGKMVKDKKTGKKIYVPGASKNEFKYVSNKKLYKLKTLAEDYIEQLCKDAKDGKITQEVLDKAKNRNMIFNTINFVAGFSVAALFLSTIIPKVQYWVTRMKTGRNDFPGLYEFEEENKQIANA